MVPFSLTCYPSSSPVPWPLFFPFFSVLNRESLPSLSLVFLFFPFYSSAPDGLSALGEPIAKSAQAERCAGLVLAILRGRSRSVAGAWAFVAQSSDGRSSECDPTPSTSRLTHNVVSLVSQDFQPTFVAAVDDAKAVADWPWSWSSSSSFSPTCTLPHRHPRPCVMTYDNK